MGKHGPCYHCGVTSTPLWRNGPPDKPVLCNACGSRWRTKGSLTNYTPLHARGPLEHFEEYKISKEQKMHKIKESNGNAHSKCEMVDCDQNFHRVYDEDISNRSSSGSAVSYSESCAYFGSTDVSDVTGSLQSNVWESLVPSKKRTSVTRPKPSSVEKLAKDLHFILHQQSSYLSGLSEEELLYENGTPKGSVEICNGGVLIRNSNLSTLEEESEASSLLEENKSIYSELPLPVHVHSRGLGLSNMGNEKLRRARGHEHGKSCQPKTTLLNQGLGSTVWSSTSTQAELKDRSQENFHMLRSRDSQLGFVDLKEVVNLEGLMRHFTHDEQLHLLKHLPSTDTAKAPESLESLFSSPQFQETLSCFQMLLRQGVFDLSFSGANSDECRTLRRHVLLDLTKSTWVEHSKMLKDTIYKRCASEQKVVGGTNLVCSSNSASLKRPHDGQNQNFQEMKVVIKNPRKVCKTGAVALASVRSPKLNHIDTETKSIHVTSEYMDSDGSCFSPRSLFAYTSDRSSMLDSLQFSDEKPEQDFLLDIHSNSTFPEAELLSDLWKVKVLPNSSSAESAISEKEDGLPCYPSSSSSSKQPSGSIHA